MSLNSWLSVTLLLSLSSTVDGFVLNCDCVYEPLYGLSWKLLVETMDELLKVNPDAVVITSLERRKADGVDNFLAALVESTSHISKVERILLSSSSYPIKIEYEEVQLYRIYGRSSE